MFKIFWQSSNGQKGYTDIPYEYDFVWNNIPFVITRYRPYIEYNGKTIEVVENEYEKQSFWYVFEMNSGKGIGVWEKTKKEAIIQGEKRLNDLLNGRFKGSLIKMKEFIKANQ